jgi:hypothetical protein
MLCTAAAVHFIAIIICMRMHAMHCICNHHCDSVSESFDLIFLAFGQCKVHDILSVSKPYMYLKWNRHNLCAKISDSAE